jgi:glycosyltransferase involved in cell wall biosynthesis
MSGRRLRVLNIITRMIRGGAQETAMLQAALLDPERFQCEILTGPETGSEGSLQEETRARGIPLHVEPSLVRAVRPWQDLRALKRIEARLRGGRYDIVHTHTSKAGVLGRVAARRAGVPVVVHTAHGWAFHVRGGGYWAPIERWCARRCDAIVVVSRTDETSGLAHGVGVPSQYHLIRSGIELDTFRAPGVTRDEMRRRLGWRPQAFVVGMVGRLSPQKAPLDLVAAFARIAAERPELELALIGDGPLRADVDRAFESAGLAGRVHRLGLRADVPQLLVALDALALTSRWEGMPRVFPQAMAARLPILATAVNGAREAVVAGETGLLVPPGDVAAIAAALRELATDPARARRMGEAGARRAEEFSAELMARQLEALYESLWERRTGAAPRPHPAASRAAVGT